MRWGWLIVLLTLAASGITSLYVKRLPVEYQAKARLIIGPGIDSLNPDLSALRAGGQLMQTYAELPNTNAFLKKVIEDLNLDISPETVSRMITVKINQETQILSVEVQDKNPDLVVPIANAVANNLVQLSPSSVGSTANQLQDQMRIQAQKTEQMIADTENTISQLEAELANTTDPERQKFLVDQLTQDRKNLSDASTNLTILYNKLQETTTNQVKFLEQAKKAEPAVSQNQLKILLAGLAGLILGVAIAFVYEFMDDSVKSGEELVEATGLPLLSLIPKHKPFRKEEKNKLVVSTSRKERSKERAAENYRILGTKLLSKFKILENGAPSLEDNEVEVEANSTTMDMNSKHGQSILVTSAKGNEESGVVAANLATAMSQAGRRIILVDANLRQPCIHKLVEINSMTSLVQWLVCENCFPDRGLFRWSPTLSILPSYARSDHPYELLSTSEMTRLIGDLKSQCDALLIVTAPLLTSAESLLLANQMDGVILAAQAGKSQKAELAEAAKTLKSMGANTIGTVLDFNSPKIRVTYLSFPTKFRVPSFGKLFERIGDGIRSLTGRFRTLTGRYSGRTEPRDL
jgi:capsular polysaccharide biosynthesis protein